MQVTSPRVGPLSTQLESAPGIIGTSAADLTADLSTAGTSMQARTLATGSTPARYQQWGRLSEAQNQIAQLQAADQALTQAYQQLRPLAQRLQSSAMSTEQQQRWGEQLGLLSQQVQQQGRLDSRLQPVALEGDAARHRYQLDKVDLLSPRSVRERVTLLLAGQQQAMGITIAPGQRPTVTLAQLNRHLAPIGIIAESEQGKLQLVAKERADAILRQPILMQGEGVRVPAGEPVLIKATPEPDALAPLQAAAQKGELLNEREHISRVMNRIQDYSQRLQEQRQVILQQTAQAWPTAAKEPANTPLPAHASRFEQLVSALLAQANVSRHSAVALLRKE